MAHALLIVGAASSAALAWLFWEHAGTCLARGQLGIRHDDPRLCRWAGLGFAIVSLVCARAA